MPSRYRDRREAGRLLAAKLAHYANRPDVVVLALPRGGVPVAYEVARALGAPLDVFVVRKLGIPGQEEVAMGAVATGGVRVLNHQLVRGLGIPDDVLEAVVKRELQELARRERLYRGNRPPPAVRGKTVILVDDGLATGATMPSRDRAHEPLLPCAVATSVRRRAPLRRNTCARAARAHGSMGCRRSPRDVPVRSLTMQSPVRPNAVESVVTVPVGDVTIEGNLRLPEAARGVVLFAHGSGSSRFSPRNRAVAEVLNEAKLATLLIDLLTPDEEVVDTRTAHLRFDIPLLAERLVGATDWLARHPGTRDLRIGYFGASTGAAAALVAAAKRPDLVHAIVSRGGRPDLAGPALPLVRAATLLIVGGRDVQVIELNQQALAQLRCEKRLVIVPGATHLFEEPGALEQVARLAREWFERCLTSAPTCAPDVNPPRV